MKLKNRKKNATTEKANDFPPVVHVITEPDRHRPCLVRAQLHKDTEPGDNTRYYHCRRAIFHRWVSSANPVLPRGVEINENARYYQFRRTEALVEYEDGTVARVYPSDVQFIDGGEFDAWDWDTMEAQHETD